MNDTFTNGIEESMDNLFNLGAFLTAGNIEKANTMTVSWGSIGYMWKKPMFMILVRQTRYTKEFLDNGNEFTISIPYGDELKKALGICGSKSGRDIDKEEVANIKHVQAKNVIAPIVEGCNKYYECKVVFKQDMDLDNIDEAIKAQCYKEGESEHTLYFGEIVEQY
jgi:flavin reductase (DIM6/NTAB) family NADH-FMN oxidoreductase RutF